MAVCDLVRNYVEIALLAMKKSITSEEASYKFCYNIYTDQYLLRELHLMQEIKSTKKPQYR
jgi:hypothetical protein